MGFICDVFIVGFWFTAGVLTCIVIWGVVVAIALRMLTNWDYRKYGKVRK